MLIIVFTMLIVGICSVNSFAQQITISVTPEKPLINQTITVTVSAPGAEQIRLFNAYGEGQFGDKPHKTFIGDSGTHLVSFLNSEKMRFQADACFNGVWSDRSPEKIVLFTKLGELAPLQATVPEKIESGTALHVSFQKVQNAEKIDYCVYPAGERCSTSYTISADYTSYDIPQTAELAPGDYSIRFYPEKDGYVKTQTVYSFKIEGEPLKRLEIPEETLEIKSEAFKGVDASVVVVPYSTDSIGDSAFADCADLKSVFVRSYSVEFGENVFAGSPNVVIYGHYGSTAETYAADNNIPFKHLEY